MADQSEFISYQHKQSTIGGSIRFTINFFTIEIFVISLYSNNNTAHKNDKLTIITKSYIYIYVCVCVCVCVYVCVCVCVCNCIQNIGIINGSNNKINSTNF